MQRGDCGNDASAGLLCRCLRNFLQARELPLEIAGGQARDAAPRQDRDDLRDAELDGFLNDLLQLIRFRERLKQRHRNGRLCTARCRGQDPEHGRADHVGHLGYAGEFGHTCVVEDGRTCGCGHKGCLEAYAGAAGIVRTANEMMAETDTPSLMRDLPKLSPRTIFECCEQGDEMAIEVFRRAGEILGIGLANYASIIDPEAIILTGGISHAGKWLLEPLSESFEKHVFGNMRGKIKIFISRLNDRERDVLGASALAWSVPEYSLFK